MLLIIQTFITPTKNGNQIEKTEKLLDILCVPDKKKQNEHLKLCYYPMIVYVIKLNSGI